MKMYVVRFWRRLIEQELKTKEDVKVLFDKEGITKEEYDAITAD